MIVEVDVFEMQVMPTYSDIFVPHSFLKELWQCSLDRCTTQDGHIGSQLGFLDRRQTYELCLPILERAGKCSLKNCSRTLARTHEQ